MPQATDPSSLSDLEGIRKYAEKMNKRGFGHRLFTASADKASVNEWRQRLTTSWSVFTVSTLALGTISIVLTRTCAG
jgi:hypothetical protein